MLGSANVKDPLNLFFYQCQSNQFAGGFLPLSEPKMVKCFLIEHHMRAGGCLDIIIVYYVGYNTPLEGRKLFLSGSNGGEVACLEN